MVQNKSTRASRDGDQFHYYWAARRCLLLIAPTTELVAITVEGASPIELGNSEGLDDGSDLIDVAEYHGSEAISDASLVRYIQLKHSTLNTLEPWQPSGVKRTLAGFADRYRAFRKLSDGDLSGRLEFRFISNRPISEDILQAVEDVRRLREPVNRTVVAKLEVITGLEGPDLADFCGRLHLEGLAEDYRGQRVLLAQDISGYLPGVDVDAPTLLKELVTRKATSDGGENPVITKIDVLRELKTDESRLFPAPCLVSKPRTIVPRAQERDLAAAISTTEARPIIIHAAGGVGKSVFATRIKSYLPEKSELVLFDCFGNGEYRNPSRYRHRHKDALVQMANELASKGLCYPLVPAPNADQSDYTRAFLNRLEQCVSAVRARAEDAILCVVIDAADNAQMAADEIHESRSFVRDLLRATIPAGVRLVALCRSHRIDLLDPPPSAVLRELEPFQIGETAAHLRSKFPGAKDADVNEFHRSTSQNPRVQNMALSWDGDLQTILRKLGPNPVSADDTIELILEQSVAKLRDEAGKEVERSRVDRICAGLAVLRPLVPIRVLALAAGVHEAAIRSFAFDLGRPILVVGETLQFVDEPAETWFRTRFKPTGEELKTFIAGLKPLARESSYVASVIPQLMLESGQFSELVEMALTSADLPQENPIDKRDVELQRLQFAIKAGLRSRRYTEAAKLALKAAGESAGDARQRELMQANTDIASALLPADRVEELVSRRSFGSGWLGSHHAYEASLMSGCKELIPGARSRLRMANEWLRSWSKLPPEQRKQEEISDEDIVELATAALHIHGVTACIEVLTGWRPREVTFRVSRILARKLIDHGSYGVISELAEHPDRTLHVVLAITLELREVQKAPTKEVVSWALRRIARLKGLRTDRLSDARGDARLDGIVAVVEAACHLAIATRQELAKVLAKNLPDVAPYGAASRYADNRDILLRAYSLKAALNGALVEPVDVAHHQLRERLDKIKANSNAADSDEREFLSDMGILLPWCRLWAKVVTGEVSQGALPSAIADACSESNKGEANYYYREYDHTSDEVAKLWGRLVLRTQAPREAAAEMTRWIEGRTHPVRVPALAYLARLFAATECASYSFSYIRNAFALIRDERMDAESKATSYVTLSRAILAASKSEATELFNHAVEVASKIGDENLERWSALLDLADNGSEPGLQNPELAYKFARCAELTYGYVVRDKHFDWSGTVKAIAGLCGPSSFAILSRWRDRSFGWSGRLLPIAVNFHLRRGAIQPRTAVALLGFQAHWNMEEILSRALGSCSCQAEKQQVWEHVYRYASLSGLRSEQWVAICATLQAHGVESQPARDLADHAGSTERVGSNPHDEAFTKHSRADGDERDWDAVFLGADLLQADALSSALDRFRDGTPPNYLEAFFAEAFRRIGPGDEARFIGTVAENPRFDLLDYRTFFGSVPEDLRPRFSVRSALSSALKKISQRFCLQVSSERYYATLPLGEICNALELSRSEIVELALAATGELSEPLSAGRLLNLVGLISNVLSEEQCRNTLSFGLDLFEPVLDAKDGDGPWVGTLAPPSSIEAAIAGYVWAALAAPRSSVRWQASHVVRGLTLLEDRETLLHIVDLARRGVGGAFVDVQLHFYRLHAAQWLLIGISRAAKEAPTVLVDFADFLNASTESSHVLIRQYAAEALRSIHESNSLTVSADDESRLRTINRSPFAPVEASTGKAAMRSAEDRESFVEGQFNFGIDMGPYWYDPLGRLFGLSQFAVEREARRIIKDTIGYAGSSSWEADERTRRKMFRDREAYHSHGTEPRAHDLRFYLSYHAMMYAAGEFLATIPLQADEYETEPFESWLRRFGLARSDGKWLSDRRDVGPLEESEWKQAKADNDWRRSAGPADFETALVAKDGCVNLWGRWLWTSGDREESVAIGSALVAPGTSDALLRALQTTENPYDYRIPDAEDELQIDEGPFKLKGWVLDKTREGGIDEQDPWGGGYTNPPLVPDRSIESALSLVADSDNRIWQREGKAVLWSQVWGERGDDQDEGEREHGRRLRASMQFVRSLLKELQMHLIVEVQITRARRHSRYEGDEDGYTLPAARIFVIHPDGSIASV